MLFLYAFQISQFFGDYRHLRHWCQIYAFPFSCNFDCFWKSKHGVDMEVTVDIRFEQLLYTVKKLPAAKIKQLKSALDEGYIGPAEKR